MRFRVIFSPIWSLPWRAAAPRSPAASRLVGGRAHRRRALLGVALVAVLSALPQRTSAGAAPVGPLLTGPVAQRGPGADGARHRQALQDPALGAAVKVRRPVPEGLRRLASWEDLRALRAFFERVDVSETAADLRRPPVSAPHDLGRLAALFRSWQEAFEYVRDRVGYAPYRGAVRGAAGTLEAGSGNALDQALLLRELLRRQGRSVRLVRGRLDWASAATLVVGPRPPSSAGPGDPWPRWLEAAADHWWLEAEIESSWTTLDPSFPDSTPGVARAVPDSRLDRLPAEELGRLRIELLRGSLAVAELELSTAEAIGTPLELFVVPVEADLSAAAGQAGAAAGAAAAGGEPLPVVPPPVAAPVPPQDPARLEEVRDFPRIVTLPPAADEAADDGPWMAVLRVGDRHEEVGPFDATDLADLRLRARVDLWRGAPQELVAPWGGSAAGKLVVIVSSGSVARSRLVSLARPLHDALVSLARAESVARDAMRPPRDYGLAVEALRDSGAAAWNAFEELAPRALGWALLEAIDGLSMGSRMGRLLRPGLRMAAVRWRPPGAADSGAFSVTLSDPVVIGQLSGDGGPAPLQAAYGLLQSAVVSQILHRMADRAPQTPFDVTLLAFGTGAGVGVWTSAASLPEAWPPAARAASGQSIDSGFAVVGPWLPQRLGGEEVLGWWELGRFDGGTRGWVLTRLGSVQGGVEFGAAREAAALEDLLASLPILHRGLRWLTTMGADDAELARVSAAACGSAAVAAESMRAALPPSWPRPAVAVYCGAGSGA